MKRAFGVGFVALACSLGCGNTPSDAAGPAPNAGPQLELGGHGSTTTPGNGNGNGNGNGAASACVAAADETGCVGEQYEGETAPLDVYILFDQSCSMSCPISRGGPGQCCAGATDGRIVPVRAALNQFLAAPESAGIGFGLGFFGSQPLGQASCDPTDYAAPSVPIARGQVQQLEARLAQAEPTGETPTGAALRGACGYAQQAKRGSPGHSVVILLVTDGIPETPVTDCGATLPDAVAAARSCAEAETPIKTYVLGVGQALRNLDQIAKAGGTKQAQLVEGGDVTRAVLTALNAIRGDAVIPCELVIPPAPASTTLDYDRVNLGICDLDGRLESTVRVDSRASCGTASGWYYDDAQAPSKIVLCPTSCNAVGEAGAQLYYSVGCATNTVVR